MRRRTPAVERALLLQAHRHRRSGQRLPGGLGGDLLAGPNGPALRLRDANLTSASSRASWQQCGIPFRPATSPTPSSPCRESPTRGPARSLKSLSNGSSRGMTRHVSSTARRSTSRRSSTRSSSERTPGRPSVLVPSRSHPRTADAGSVLIPPPLAGRCGNWPGRTSPTPTRSPMPPGSPPPSSTPGPGPGSGDGPSPGTAPAADVLCTPFEERCTSSGPLRPGPAAARTWLATGGYEPASPAAGSLAGNRSQVAPRQRSSRISM